MHPGQVSFPALLKEAGYHTGVIGKVHVAPASAVPFDFDTNGDLPGSKTNDIGLVTSYIEKFFAEDFEGPFLLMVNFFDPHHPPEGKNNYIYDQIGGLPEHPLKPEDVEPFPFLKRTDARTQQNVAGYYNCVNRLDVGVGRLLDILRREGHEDNTLVIFLGDHGPPFPGGKLTCYEAGLRVPFLVRWPGRAKESLVRDEMISTIDIMPTVLEAAGVPTPEDLRGRSLIPLLEGKAATGRDVMFGEFNWHTRSTFRPTRSVRDERYKLILSLRAEGEDDVELFDLQDDPHEFNNLAGRESLRDVQDRLMKQLLAWRQRTNDPLLDRGQIALQREKYYAAN
jgi:N-sulfoglucosamine sulfohydrolase